MSLAILLVTLAPIPAAAQTYLLVDQSELDAAAAKAKKYPWAAAILDTVLADAEAALTKPVELPDRGGQWGSWYSCKKDGIPLVTDSPTRHRCPKCGTVYTGYPYDEVVIARVHGSYSYGARQCGLAFRFTGRKEFARRAGEILLAYADRYNSYPRHDQFGKNTPRGGRITAQTLNESQILISMAWAYALVRDTLDEAARKHIEKDLLLAAAQVIRDHDMKIHNIQCWKNSAVGAVGFAINNQELIHDAIDDPEHGFRAQIAKGVTDDGLWYEGSMGYHVYTMSALWILAEAARHAGINLYSDRYRTLFDAPIRLAFPNGDAPLFNDNGKSNVKDHVEVYELAYTRWKLPLYAHVLAVGKRTAIQSLLYGEPVVADGPIVPEESVLFRSAGFAMLRESGTTAAVRFGLHGGGHGHRDKLNLLTFSGGQQFGADPGSINYGVPLYFEWYRATVAHNTVTVDGSQQAAVDGEFEDWNTAPGSTTLAATANHVYPDVELHRTISLRAMHISDTFTCSSTAEHTYDWAFHSFGNFTSSLPFAPLTGKLGETNGYQHIETLVHARTDGDWWAEWEVNGARSRIRMKGEPGTEIFQGVAPGPDPRERIAMIVVRRRSKSTVFQAEHQFTRRR